MSDHPSSLITTEARTELRDEFRAAMLAQKELLITDFNAVTEAGPKLGVDFPA